MGKLLFFFLPMTMCGSIFIFQFSFAAVREKKIFEIYRQGESTPTSEENWSAAVEANGEEVYEVNDGDTLWDVSETLFGDPDYWPKMWAVNQKDVFNPHQIEPGEKIFFQFSKGVARSDEDVSSNDDTEGASNEDEVEDSRRVQIVGRSNEKIPVSLPQGLVKGPTTSFNLTPLQRVTASSELDLRYLLTAKPLDVQATVVEAEEHPYLVVQFARDPGTAKTFLVTRVHPVQDQLKDDASAREILAQVEVLERVEKDKDQFFYRARLLKEFEPVEKGSELVVSEIPTYDLVASDAEPTQKVGKILRGGDETSIYGPSSIVFLKAPTATFQTADELPVFRNPQARFQASDEDTGFRRVGLIKVISSVGKVAIGVVLNTEGAVHTDDYLSSLTPVEE